MPSFHVNRSIDIKAPAEKVFNALADFHTWTTWSPWLIQEPEAKVNVREDGKYYEWEGNRVGSGNMTMTNESANDSLELDIFFLKPWKSKSKVKFFLKSNGESTNVKWTMDGNLPFFMFWMKKMMDAWVGMDYERGLMMLKDYLEIGSVPSKLNFIGNANYEGCQYIGVKVSTSKKNVGDTMKDAFGKLNGYFQSNQELISAPAFSMYLKWDMVKDNVEYISAIPVSSVPSDLPSGFVTGTIPQTPVYTLGHTGPYYHLGNAWATMYGMQRAKNFKQNKKIMPFEVYKNVPGEVADNELITEVNFAVK